MNERVTDKNYWIEYKEKFKEFQHLFSKSAYFTADVNLNIFQNSLHAKSSIKEMSGNPIPGRKKDDIKFFSKNSRTRLFKLFSCISFKEFRKIYFCSLSFHFDEPENNIELKRFLDKLIKRLKRFDSSLHFIWRFEFQKRGSPHFHFIILVPKTNKEFREIKFKHHFYKSWIALKGCNCKDCMRYSFDLQELEHYRKAISYVSKYVAKENDQVCGKYTGRRWGRSANIPLAPLEVINVSCYRFIYLKKLLYEYYKKDPSKSSYLNENLYCKTSLFIFVDSLDLNFIWKRVIEDDREFIFKYLMKDKILPGNLVYDEINLRIGEYENKLRIN